MCGASPAFGWKETSGGTVCRKANEDGREGDGDGEGEGERVSAGEMTRPMRWEQVGQKSDARGLGALMVARTTLSAGRWTLAWGWNERCGSC